MTAELHELAASLGIDLAAPTAYQLEDDGPPIYGANGHHPHCPFGCGDAHLGEGGQPGEGSSCPWRRVPLTEALPDPFLRDLKLGGAL